MGLAYSDYLCLTPPEINWRIEAWNEEKARQDLNIYDLGSLVFLAFNNPKQFPKSIQKFRPSRITEKLDDLDKQAMKDAGAKVGMRVPV